MAMARERETKKVLSCSTLIAKQGQRRKVGEGVGRSDLWEDRRRRRRPRSALDVDGRRPQRQEAFFLNSFRATIDQCPLT